MGNPGSGMCGFSWRENTLKKSIAPVAATLLTLASAHAADPEWTSMVFNETNVAQAETQKPEADPAKCLALGNDPNAECARTSWQRIGDESSLRSKV